MLLVILNGIVLVAFAVAQDRGPVREPNAGPVQDEQTVAVKKSSETAPNSFVENFLRNIKNGVGMSVGVTETYVPQFFATAGDGPKSTTYMTLSPHLFFGYQRSRSEFLFDYSFGYRKYNTQSLPGSSTQSAGLLYRYRASPNVTLTLSDQFRSAVNDNGFSIGSTLTSLSPVNFDQLLYVPRQRLSTQELRGEVDMRVGKRTNIGVFGTYGFWRYHDTAVQDTHSGEIGVRGSHQINKWLSVDNSFSHYLGGPTNANGLNIQRLQVGGLSFRSAREMVLSVGGGVETANSHGRQTTARALVSLTKNSRSTSGTITYHRGFSLAIGAGSLIEGDNISVAVTQWIGRRMNLKMSGLYTRGTSVADARLDAVSGDASFEMSFGNHVLFTGQYGYLSQRSASLSSLIPNASRSTATVGLQYFLSSLRGF
jgi:hypothetical protein